ncbi:MAG TPA: site-2 protease family protein [Candidatus Brocadiia bacterium]|nr:site-2 protease family protein [Candidatus Brocadiia bacterium]
MLVFELFRQDPRLAMFFVFLCVMALTVHEFAHAYAAQVCGDDTARLMGRMTLNPAAHLDPLGTILILLIGFGWAKPVPVNPLNFRRLRKDDVLVSAAGPASNLILAVILAVIVRIMIKAVPGGPALDTAYFLAGYGVTLNVALAIFNLLPLFPLDGAHIAENLLPAPISTFFVNFRPYARYVFIVFLVSRIGGALISVPAAAISTLLCGF